MAVYSLWPGSNPGFNPSVNAGSGISLGCEFRVTTQCWLTGFRFYRENSTVNPSQVRLYSVVSSVSGTGVTGAWFNLPSYTTNGVFIDVILATPIRLTTNQRYKVVFLYPTGYPSMADLSYFTTGAGSAGITNGPLVAPNKANSIGGAGQMSWQAGTSIAYPATYSGSAAPNYLNDVIVTDVNPFTVHAGAVDLVGAAEVGLRGIEVPRGVIDLVGTAALSAVGRQIVPAALMAVGEGTLTLVGRPGTVWGMVTLTGAGVLDLSGHRVHQGALDLVAEGVVAAQGASGPALRLVDVGELELRGRAVLPGALSVSGTGEVTFAGSGLAVPLYRGDLALVEFAVLNDDGSLRAILPDVMTYTLSPLFNDVGSVTLDYPSTGINFDILHEGVQQDRDLNIQISINGAVQPRLQAILNESSGDDIVEGSVWTFNGNFTAQWLTEAVVEPKAGMPSQGEDPEEEQDAHFYSVTAGQIMRTLLQEANARGALTHVVWASIGNDEDSNGVPWSLIITLKFSPGLDLLKILTALVSYGMCDFEMIGNELRMYEADTISVDRTLTDPPLIFQAGRDLVDSPRRHSVRDTATAVLAAGGEGIYYTATDATALAKRGRRIESYISQGNMTTVGSLQAYAESVLGTLTSGKMEKTHGLVFAQSAQPMRDYMPGDWAFSALGTGLERLRIKQITWSGDVDGGVLGSVVLNDLFAERLAALTRRINGIVGGSTVTGTSQARPRAEDFVDNVGPVTPTGLIVNSQAYETSGVIQAAAFAQWDPVLENEDGTALDDLDYYVVRWRYTDPALANIVNGVNLWTVEGLPQEESLNWSPVAPGQQIEVQIVARDTAGNYSSYSASVFHITAEDVLAPPQPSAPLVSTLFGSIRVEWDGLGSEGEPMPPDFYRLEVHASLQNAFTPDVTTLYTSMTGAGVTTYVGGAYGVTVFFRFVARDRSGNVSAVSVVGSGTSRQVLDQDIFEGAVGTAKLADAVITSAKIGLLQVNDAHMSDVSIGKLTTGTLLSDVIIGATFATALSGGRVGFNADGFFAFDALDIQTVRVSADGSAMFMGEFATRDQGERILFNPGGLAPTDMRFYPNTGVDNFTRIIAGTLMDGFGTEHSRLTMVGDRHTSDIGEPVLEFLGPRGELAWKDWLEMDEGTVFSRIWVDRFSAQMSSSEINLNLEEHDVVSPDNRLNINFTADNARFLRFFLSTSDRVVIQGTRELVFFSSGLASRSGSDGSYAEMYASAFIVNSSFEGKTDFREFAEEILDIFDAAPARLWRFRRRSDTPGGGDIIDPRVHAGPVAEDLPVELTGVISDTGEIGVNIDDKIGIAWEVLRRTRIRVRAQLAGLRDDLMALQTEARTQIIAVRGDVRTLQEDVRALQQGAP